MEKIDPLLPNKVICITGDIISTQNKEFLEKAKLPCVTKPFSIDELMLVVKSNLGEKDAKKASINR
jgi:DNA-binding response OmpR family regulator